jgi:hypothetical protein
LSQNYKKSIKDIHESADQIIEKHAQDGPGSGRAFALREAGMPTLVRRTAEIDETGAYRGSAMYLSLILTLSGTVFLGCAALSFFLLLGVR